MTLKIQFKKPAAIKADAAIIYVYEDKKIGANGTALDKKSSGLIKSAIKNANTFSAKLGETLIIHTSEKTGFNSVVCLGIGKITELSALKAEEAGGKLCAALKSAKIQKAALLAEEIKQKKVDGHEIAAHIANGCKLRAYHFDRYKTPDKNNTPLKTLIVIDEHMAAVKKIFNAADSITEGVFTARDLVNEPPNELEPVSYAAFIKKELTPLGIKVEIFDEKKLEKIGMGGIMAVGKGSEKKPRMVIMRWENAKKKSTKPVALVGKGVTFDTGGISLKPGAGMDEMKMDMGGSAAVVGTMKALALRNAKANVIGVVGLAENMPASNAYRPGDILKSYSGKTIEILNTDAEGRLVLADCLTYTQEKFKPEIIIDLATLTGAMMVALAHEYCGTFVNNDPLWKALEKASNDTGEKLWRMPLDPHWKSQMESEVADVQNMAKSPRFGGACTAAGFLEHFIDEGQNWAHMDIAGTAWVKSDAPTTPKFGTGFGVRVLNQLIADNYEA